MLFRRHNATLSACVLLAWLAATLPATEPEIYDVELLEPTLVNLHFNTDANRLYILQYKNSLASTNWTEMYRVNPVPFMQHFVITDTMTNGNQRFYRLVASP